MKLSEIFLDKIRCTALYEMAYSRDEAWKKCTGLVQPLTLHLLKILVMPSSVHVSHWKKEIKNYLDIMLDIKLKPNNKRLSYGTYREWLIEQPDFREKHIFRKINNLKKDHLDEKFEIPDTIIDDYKSIMERICVNLGNDEETEL